ncbi:hypothetical protein CYR52_18115 [Chimaeribacter arupi]|nr:hypothetical protein CYR52_18115 [Chimaeribacter arupi]
MWQQRKGLRPPGERGTTRASPRFTRPARPGAHRAIRASGWLISLHLFTSLLLYPPETRPDLAGAPRCFCLIFQLLPWPEGGFAAAADGQTAC